MTVAGMRSHRDSDAISTVVCREAGGSARTGGPPRPGPAPEPFGPPVGVATPLRA